MINVQQVQAALALPSFDPAPAWRRMAPSPLPSDVKLRISAEGSGGGAPLRQAGVLLLLYPAAEDLHFVLTRRGAALTLHGGQVSLPGGSIEVGDASLEQAALRETCEEIGACGPFTPLGQLSPIFVSVSRFQIHPYVAYAEQRPAFQPAPQEVDALLQVPLSHLLDDARKETEDWDFNGQVRQVPFYRLEGQIVWGATAAILSEFEVRLRQAMGAA